MSAATRINTSRFGPLEIPADSIIHFPKGILGFGQCRQWVLVTEGHAAVAWLQNVERPEVALMVASPRRFLPGYQLRVARRELAPLQLDQLGAAEVLAIVGKTDRGLTLNLKAPVVINTPRALGSQVIANGDLPVRFDLEGGQPTFRRTA